jgi:hypothetical protein
MVLKQHIATTGIGTLENMAKLIITDAEGVTRDFPLSKERVSIGRHPDNDISLNDKAVSGKHAVIITILRDSFLEDLNSTNGTQVNGKAVAKHPLSNGDTVSIGRNTLKYQGDAASADEDDFEKTMILRPGQLGGLRVASGANMGKELELTKALTTIGRPGVQVAAITRRADGYYIVHVGGASGGQHPLVNGLEIDTQARKLNNGDIIDLVGTKMSFILG